MDKIPVQIRVHSRQRLADGTEQTFTSRARGFVYHKGETIYVAYQEQENEELSAMLTTWKLESNRAILIRQGTSSLRALFQIGTDDSTALVTPNGRFPIAVNTYRLDNRMTPKGGILRVGYRMDLAGSVSRMDLELQVKSDE
jgi:uncharacterized beta-barrel protein YwiB (DUF1934 family)